MILKTNPWGIIIASMLVANGAFAGESPGSAYRRGDYEKTIKLLKPQAQAGNIDAQIMLGQMYLKGEGVKADMAQGTAWIRKAADEGSAIGAYDLGVFSMSGYGQSVDIPAAAGWFRKAAHQRYAEAAFRLAALYHGGQGIEQSDTMALNWIDAGIEYLDLLAGRDARSRFRALRESILTGMSPEQISAASRLVSADGPVTAVNLRNPDAWRKDAVKEYPLGLGHLGRGGNVVALVLVHNDGTVGNSMIETSSGYPALDSATLRVLGRADIEPRIINGQPVESWQIMQLTWQAEWDSFGPVNALPRPH